jgi:hypothetical protein
MTRAGVAAPAGLPDARRFESHRADAPTHLNPHVPP